MKDYKIIREEIANNPFGIDKKFALLESKINDMAAQGWELKTILDRGANVALIFERQK